MSSQLSKRQPNEEVGWQSWITWQWNHSTRVKPGMKLLSGIVSLLCVVTYIWDTYADISEVNRYVYLVAACVFLTEMLMKLMASRSKLRFLIQVSSLIDIATIIAGFINYVDHIDMDQSINFLRILRLFMVIKFFKSVSLILVMWLRGSVTPSELELYSVISDLFLVLSAVVFVGGCIFYEIEGQSGRSGSPSYLHQAWYWACVTITTIGYGDFYPSSVVGQMLFPVMVIMVLLIVPARVSNLSSTLAVVTKYMRKVYKSWKHGRHVVLLGNINHVNVASVLDEFFHVDRGTQDAELVIMAADPPGPDMTLLLTSHHARAQCHYLQGSPFVPMDLSRASVGQALAVFVLCNKYAQDPVADDTRTLLTVLALAQHLRKQSHVSPHELRMSATSILGSCGPHILPDTHLILDDDLEWDNQLPHIIVQFHLSETIMRARSLLKQQNMHPLQLGLSQRGQNSMFPVSCDFIKHTMLGASVHTPGLITLLSGLTSAFSLPKNLDTDGMGWVAEYIAGASIEIYTVNFPPDLAGCTFAAAAQALFLEHGAILLGMYDAEDADHGWGVNLAPFEHAVIHPDRTIGFVLSGDQDLARRSSMLTSAINESYLKKHAQKMNQMQQTTETTMAKGEAFARAPSRGAEPGLPSVSEAAAATGATVQVQVQATAGAGAGDASPQPAQPNRALRASSEPTMSPSGLSSTLGNSGLAFASLASKPIVNRHAVTMHPLRNRLHMASEPPTLESVDSLPVGAEGWEYVIITGNSCFDHLDELLSAILCRTHTSTGTSLQFLPSKRYQSLRTAQVVIMDPEGPSDSQKVQLSGLTQVVHLKACPCEITDMPRLHLPQGCSVRALVFPDLDKLTEGAALGSEACEADAQAMHVCSNLRAYCDHVQADLDIWTEAVLPLNVGYLLPLCVGEGTYREPPHLNPGLSLHSSMAGMLHFNTMLRQIRHEPTSKLSLREVEEQEYKKYKALKTLARVLKLNPGLSPSQATGHVFTASLIDKIFIQTVFNPLLVQILAKLMGVWHYAGTTEEAPAHRVQSHDGQPGARVSGGGSDRASGRQAHTAPQSRLYLLPLSDLIDQLLSQLGKKVDWGVLRRGAGGPGGDGANDAQVKTSVPTWGDLFMQCLQNNVLTIGLYRRDEESGFPYVATSPEANIPLRASDEVYVVTSPLTLKNCAA